MKYHEKLQLAEEAADMLSDGKTLEAVSQLLGERGYYPFDIDKILFSAKSELSDRYGEKIRQYLEEGQLESKRQEFPFLKDDIFNTIRERQVTAIVDAAKAKINALMQQGVDEREIITKTTNAFFSEKEARDQMIFYAKFNFKVSGAEKQKYLLIGIACILIGGGLTIFSFSDTSMRRSYIFYGLIVVGIVNLIKAFSTKGQIESMP